MKLSDKITITIALCALFLSLLSIYLQFFYSSNALKVHISISETGENHVIYDVVFINDGTGYQTISNIMGWTSYLPLEENGNWHGINLFNEPIIIEPGRMLYRRLKHDCAPKTLFLEEVYTGVQFTTIDSSGHRNKLLAPLVSLTPGETGYQYEYVIEGGIFNLSAEDSNKKAKIIKPLIKEVDSRSFGIGQIVTAP